MGIFLKGFVGTGTRTRDFILGGIWIRRQVKICEWSVNIVTWGSLPWQRYAPPECSPVVLVIRILSILVNFWKQIRWLPRLVCTAMTSGRISSTVCFMTAAWKKKHHSKIMGRLTKECRIWSEWDLSGISFMLHGKVSFLCLLLECSISVCSWL